MPDKWPSAKRLFAVKFFSDGSLPRAVLGKAFAEGFWAFAECPGPSAKRTPPVVKDYYQGAKSKGLLTTKDTTRSKIEKKDLRP